MLWFELVTTGSYLLAPACLLLLEALFWEAMEFWEEGPGGRNRWLGRMFEGSTLPLFLLCLPASWFASCGLSSAPRSPLHEMTCTCYDFFTTVDSPPPHPETVRQK